MNTVLISLTAGVGIGLLYALFRVRSPAPPAIALIGLLGMLCGEQIANHLLPAAHAAPQNTSATE